MLETIVGGLILAAISATFFLAYNHPPQFRAVAPYLFGSIAVAWGCAAVWWLALQRARLALVEGFGDLDYQKIDAALLNISPADWFLVGALPVTLILLIMCFGVTTLKHDKEHDEGDDKKP